VLAIAERAGGIGVDGPDRLIWHLPVGDSVDGQFQAIACSADEGIVLHGPRREVPLQLNTRGEQWCGSCLERARDS
jgi:hypothetical protein